MDFTFGDYPQITPITQIQREFENFKLCNLFYPICVICVICGKQWFLSAKSGNWMKVRQMIIMPILK